jgi:hypothetical protein
VSWQHTEPVHRRAPGEAVTNLTYSDSFDADRVASRSTAYDDVREAHEWVTRELEDATETMRVYCLTQERKRLAAIGWRLKR